MAASKALVKWKRVQIPLLNELWAQYVVSSTMPPPATLADENLRSYVVSLSGHLQEFCRGLHSESLQGLVDAIPQHLRYATQQLCENGLRLVKDNVSFAALVADFNPFGFNLSAELNRDPANAILLTHLGMLNSARNFAAHRNPKLPAAGALSSSETLRWESSCDKLAEALNDIMYNQMNKLLSTPPW